MEHKTDTLLQYISRTLRVQHFLQLSTEYNELRDVATNHRLYFGAINYNIYYSFGICKKNL